MLRNYTVSLLAALLALGAMNSLAAIQAHDVQYEDQGESFTGYIAWDDRIKGARPAVLVYPEWWGLSDYERKRARMLAALGYVAFVVDMYGTGKLTDQPDQARTWMQSVTADVDWWRERALLGLKILKDKPLVDQNRIAAIGYCFGGGTVLQLAWGGVELAGVVSFHGALPLPDEKRALKTSILVLHGDADPFVRKSSEAAFRKALAETKADWQMVSYGGVRHSFTNPAADSHGMEALHYDARADKRSWQAMRNFLSEVFAR